MAKLFPEEVNRIGEWEEAVGHSAKRGLGSFFPPRERGLNDYAAYHNTKIMTTVVWSQTTRGGRQFPLFEEPSETCILAEGLCE